MNDYKNINDWIKEQQYNNIGNIPMNQNQFNNDFLNQNFRRYNPQDLNQARAGLMPINNYDEQRIQMLQSQLYNINQKLEKIEKNNENLCNLLKELLYKK